MLESLLKSWSNLLRPQNCTLDFLVVENDDTDFSSGIVKDQMSNFRKDELRIVLETQLGIPFGRNRAAREALKSESNLLVFVDDDETVAKDWLEHLVDGYRSSTAVLLGAPVRINPLTGNHPWIVRKMHENIGNLYKRNEERAARRADLNSTHGVTIVTNNWLAEMTLFSKHGIWFDEQLQFSGGEDTKFYHEARSLGLTTGWVSDAYVYETVPPSRLSFGYQFNRGKHQSNTNFQRKIHQNGLSRLTVIISVPAKCIAVILLAVALPFTTGSTLHSLARTSGWIAGRLGALAGSRSSLYENVTGS